MEQQDHQALAAQLRKPEGDFGMIVADNLNLSNIHVTQFTYNNMNVVDGDNILEIGFGNGKLMDHLLAKASITLCGIDFSDTMVHEARAHHAGNIKQGCVEIKHGSVDGIPYPNDHFDKICHINTLYFWPDPIGCAKETLRVLKQGGSIYTGIRPKEQMEKFQFTQYGFTCYDAEEAAQLFRDAGFSHVEVKQQKNPPFDFNGTLLEMDSICVIATK